MKKKQKNSIVSIFDTISYAISATTVLFVSAVILGFFPEPYPKAEKNYMEEYLILKVAMSEIQSNQTEIDKTIEALAAMNFTDTIVDTIMINDGATEYLAKYERRVKGLQNKIKHLQRKLRITQNKTISTGSDTVENRFTGKKRDLVEGIFSKEGVEDDLDAIGRWFGL